MSLSECNIRNEGDKILLIIDGKSWLIPWQQALEISKGIYIQAKKAEEFAAANRIIADQALLTRVGMPVGLSNHPKIKEEAAKEAAWNGDLRRYLPGGVKAEAVFGTPVIQPVHTIGPHSIDPTSKMGNIGGK